MIVGRITYVTDPLCAYSWAFEPIWQRVQQEYGDRFDWTIRMGGLIEDLNGFSEDGQKVMTARDIYEHLRKMAVEYHVPIDGHVWLRDPIQSSYPAAKAFIAVRELHPDQASRFMRLLREAAFIHDRRIDLPEVLRNLLWQAGLPERSAAAIVRGLDSRMAEERLQSDMRWATKAGVDVFPTLVLDGNDGKRERVVNEQRWPEMQYRLEAFIRMDQEGT